MRKPHHALLVSIDLTSVAFAHHTERVCIFSA